MEKIIVTVLIVIVVLLLLFLILREIMCWYWKINERITLQQETNLLLKKLIDKEVISIQSGGTTSVEKKSADEIFCTNCGHKNELGAELCSNCLQKIG